MGFCGDCDCSCHERVTGNWLDDDDGGEKKSGATQQKWNAVQRTEVAFAWKGMLAEISRRREWVARCGQGAVCGKRQLVAPMDMEVSFVHWLGSQNLIRGRLRKEGWAR